MGQDGANPEFRQRTHNAFTPVSYALCFQQWSLCDASGTFEMAAA